MSTFPYTIAALVISGAACTASLATSNQPQQDALICELHLSEAKHETTITATAKARQPVKGSYELTISQRSAGGTAQIRQEGEFDLSSGAETILGEATLSARARDISADLSVHANGQTQRCGATAL